MKRIIKSLAIAAVSALAFISCSREQNPISKDNGIHFTIRTSENPQVKSFIDNNLNGTYTPKWSKGDELAMFVGGITDKTEPTATLKNINEKGETAYFEGTVTGIETAGTFKSFTPAAAFAKGYDTGNVGITLAAVQKPSSLTIDEACDILVAKESNYEVIDGTAAIDDLFFKRMFSVVKVALKGPASLNGEEVSKFSLSAPEGTVLTGRSAIDLTTATIDKWNIKNNSVTATYEADAPVFGGEAGLENVVWLVVNPCTVANGAKVVFAGETANYTFTKEVTLSKALTFPESQLAVINLTLAEENCTKKEVPTPASWIATDLADITATDEVVITMAKGESVYALTSAKGSSAAPTAVAVTVENKELAKAPAEDLVWNIANNNGSLTIYPKGQTATWLYTTDSNNGVRVGKNDNKTFVVDSDSGYLKNTTTNRYLGVYNNSDWRCYTSTSTNIGGQTLCFYVKCDPTRPTLSVDQTSKVWAADATDAFVVKVAVNSEGGDWNVTPTALDWASITVDKTAGTITVTPKGANTNETANEATITVTHTSNAMLTKSIILKQEAPSSIGESKISTLTLSSSYKFETKTGSTLNADDKIVWTVNTSSGTIQNSYHNDYFGQQFGTKNAPWTGNFVADYSNKTISKIEIVANTGSKATISVKVGDTDFGQSASITQNLKKKTTYSFEGSASGKVSLSVSGTSKAFYLGEIKVIYTE